MQKEKLTEAFRILLGFPKSLYFNLRAFPLSQALKLPVVLSHRTSIRSLKGKIELKKVKTAIVKIGLGTTQSVDFRSHRTVISIRGKWIIHGKCRIGAGCKIWVKGQLEMGEDFNMTGNSTIICDTSIRFGLHNLISWEVLIMDTDQHPIFNDAGTQINADKEIIFNDHIWISCRTTIVKGSIINDHIIIGAQSLVSGTHSTPYSLIAGVPAKVIKENVRWK